MAFVVLFYLQFNSLVWNFASLLHTAQALFEMLLLKFDTQDISRSARVLGPLYFTLFIIFVVFITMNMFISIINDNFRLVRADVHQVESHDQDLFIHIIKRLHRWCGKYFYSIKFIEQNSLFFPPEGTENRVDVVQIKPQIHVIHVAEMLDPLKRLSKKLDQLIIHIDRVCSKN
jgi:hypothetical protein